MSNVINNSVDATLAAVGSKTTYTGAGMTISGWLLSSEFAVLIGIIIGVAGFIVNWYYRHKITNHEIEFRRQQNQREEEEHQLRMKQLEKDI